MTIPFDDAILDDAIARASQGFSNNPESPNAQVEPNAPEVSDRTYSEDMQSLQKALYGPNFPPANGLELEMDAWASWARELWDSRRDAVQMHLHLVERNRLFRAGQQWISATGLGPWREPARPRDSARIVYNMIDKALDQRLQVLMDQKPGFSVTPMTGDPDDKRSAQARQLALEYQYEQMSMDRVAREAEFWAQTDGASFIHLWWNPDRGPWDERMGEESAPSKPLGDLDAHVLRVEQVRVSPNATATIKPYWMVIREVIPRAEAAYRYKVTGLDASDSSLTNGQSPAYSGSEGVGAWVLSQTTIGEGQRLRNEDTTERFTVYIEPHPDVMPMGLHLIVVGDKVVFGPSDLMWNVIPVVRVPDGSSDPSYYPRPVMEQWLDHQMRINALASKWVENIRVNAGGRFLTRPNMISTETFLGGVTSMIEIRGAGPMDEVIRPVQGFSVGNDTKEMMAIEVKAFEDASGWNAMSRGQITGESGRAIIASREQLERVFSPAVNALARAYTDWAKIALAGMAWGYDIPRSLGAVGRGRPDLARSISGSDLDGVSDVRVEPATLMPMPLSFRLYILDNMYQTGVIDAKEYRRRQMFAVVRDMTTPDEDQEARAKRVADAFRQGIPAPLMRWTDNEAIHQDVLEREILTQDDLPEEVIAAADARWKELAGQAAQKQGAVQGMGMPTAPPMAPGSPSVPNITPNNMPLASGNPPIGVVDSMQLPNQDMQSDEGAGQFADILSQIS